MSALTSQLRCTPAECPHNPHNRTAQARLVEPLPAAILATQQEAGCTRVEGGIIPQLAACLQAQQNIPASVQYQAYLCGPVEHYQGETFDGGWGAWHFGRQGLPRVEVLVLEWLSRLVAAPWEW